MKVLLAISVMLGVVASASAAPVVKPAVSMSAPKPGVAPERATTKGSRTLDDIQIEGEIPVPQVLFITARDQRRFMEFQHRRYLRSTQQLGAATPLPNRIVLNRVAPSPVKETSR